MEANGIYGGLDPRERPLYLVAEAARYLRISPATLRSWVAGRTYPTRAGERFFAPLIQRPEQGDSRLSFTNLIEAHVLRALRTRHGIPVDAVRSALDYAQADLGIDRLLARRDLLAGAGEIFIERYGQLISLSKAGQLALRAVLEDHLQRVEWDPERLPVRLFPIVYGVSERERMIVIDPFVSFGRPVIRRTGVSTAAIAERIDAGETVQDVAGDYDIEPEEVQAALVYELAA